MVKTRIGNTFSADNKKVTKIMINSVFGRSLTLRTQTETLDSRGQVESIATSDINFTGDLQFGPDLLQKFISTGVVEVGDGVLYIHPDELSTLPVAQDLIIDGNSVWEIVSQIESPELGGEVCHYSYRCKRRVNSSDY